MSEDVVHVELGARSYPVWFRTDALTELTAHAAALAVTGKAIVVTDATVAALHAAPWVETLRARGVRVTLLVMPAGEAHKTLATVQGFYDAAVAAGVDRQTPVIAFGGGVVGDVAGFLAATLLRGLPFAQVPTTVLAQVDSSVGGKTGVNLAAGKNLVGAFHQPRWVFVDGALLRTLPRREIQSGLAEVIKHGALARPALLDAVAERAPRLLVGDAGALRAVIAPAVAVKAAVVAADEREQGQRAVLNLGHTLGHAIEAEAGYGALTHGEAVALGLRYAAWLSVHRAGLPPADAARIERALDAVDLPRDWRGWLRPEVIARVAKDKKVRGECVQFVLLAGLGRPRLETLPLSELSATAAAAA